MDLSPFSLRSWQFHGFGAKQYLAQAIDRTIAEAQRYNITHLEFGVSLRHPRDYTGQPVISFMKRWPGCHRISPFILRTLSATL